MSTEITHTKEIELPISKSKVVIKTMITGADKEFIETAEARVAKMSPKGDVIAEPATMMLAHKHAEIDVYVVSIDGSATDVRKRMQKLYEDDYDAILAGIESAKKVKTPESETAS